jgi:hypothetical protein
MGRGGSRAGSNAHGLSRPKLGRCRPLPAGTMFLVNCSKHGGRDWDSVCKEGLMKLLRATALTAALMIAAVPSLTSPALAWGWGWRGGGWGWGGPALGFAAGAVIGSTLAAPYYGYGYPGYGYGYNTSYSYPGYGYGYDTSYSSPGYGYGSSYSSLGYGYGDETSYSGYGYGASYSYPAYGYGYGTSYGYPAYAGYGYAYHPYVRRPLYAAAYGVRRYRHWH